MNIDKETVNEFRCGTSEVGTTAARLIPYDLPDGNMKAILLKAPGTSHPTPNSECVFVGLGAGVTTSTSYPIAAGESLTIPLVSAKDLYAISENGSQLISWMLV